MAVSPIDLQANLGHLHDVAKTTHAKNESVVTAHLYQDQKAETDSNKLKDTVQTTKESEESKLQTLKEREEKRRREQNQREQDTSPEHGSDSQKKDHVLAENPALGNNIDFTR